MSDFGEIPLQPESEGSREEISYGQEEFVFGFDYLQKIDKADSGNNEKEQVFNELREELDNLNSMHPYVHDELREFLGVRETEDSYDDVLERKIRSMSNYELEQRLREHVRNIRSKQELFQKQAPEITKKYTDILRNYLADKGIELPDELTARRLAGTKFIYSDALKVEDVEAYPDWDEDKIREENYIYNRWCGVFAPLPETVHIKNLKTIDIDEVLGHELNHVFSGRSRIGHGQDKKDNPPFRTGLRNLYDQPRRGRKYSAVWLDEAMTEQLVLDISGNGANDTGVYLEERELFNLLRKKGKQEIPVSAFLEAYFENDEVVQDIGTRMDKYGQLLNLISESYDRNFLGELNQFVEEYGLNNAVELLSNHDGHIFHEQDTESID